MFLLSLEERPWRVPSRSRQAIVNDIAVAWYSLPHERLGERESKFTGWSIALPKRRPDGTFETKAAEDHLVAREASEFFKELNMPYLRALHLATVHEAWVNKKFTCWKDVSNILLDFDSDEWQSEGQECLDGDVEPGEKCWNDDDIDDALQDDAADVKDAAKAKQATASAAKAKHAVPEGGAAVAPSLVKLKRKSAPFEIEASRCPTN